MQATTVMLAALAVGAGAKPVPPARFFIPPPFGMKSLSMQVNTDNSALFSFYVYTPGGNPDIGAACYYTCTSTDGTLPPVASVPCDTHVESSDGGGNVVFSYENTPGDGPRLIINSTLDPANCASGEIMYWPSRLAEEDGKQYYAGLKDLTQVTSCPGSQQKTQTT